MNLMIITHKLVYKNKNGYSSSGGFVRGAEGFLAAFDEVTICAPVKHVDDKFNGEFLNRKIKIIELSFSESKIGKILLIPKIYKEIAGIQNKFNFTQLRLPSHISSIAYFALKKRKTTIFNYVGGDTYYGLVQSVKGPVKKLFIIPIAKILETLDKRIISRSLTFVTGNSLYEKYKKYSVVKIISTTLFDTDIIKKTEAKNLNNIVKKKAYKLLYVGRLNGQKGLTFLVEALSLLKDKDYKVSLTIVGDGDYRNTLNSKIKELGLTQDIYFKGQIHNRVELLKKYRNSDIFILPSLTEGTPKVLLESMSQGLPVIATEVGGIPGIIKSGINGILIPPADPVAIKDKVIELIDNPTLINDIINNGIDFAKNNTLEKLTHIMLLNINKNNNGDK